MPDEQLPQAIAEEFMQVGDIKLRVAVLDDGRRIIVYDENLQALLQAMADALEKGEPNER